MVDQSINKLNLIQDNINKLNENNLVKPEIICVSKTFSINKLQPLIDYGQVHFGENKVKEAEEKWGNIKLNNTKIKLHMIGNLQSNKAKKAVKLFDFIHSLDNVKLAKLLKKSEEELKKKISYFIQVNIGEESQKSGVPPGETKDFFQFCTDEIKLNIIGLMVIPPNDKNTDKYFEQVSELNSNLGLNHLSMGMSSDYQKAIKFKSTFLRIGSAILGERNNN